MKKNDMLARLRSGLAGRTGTHKDDARRRSVEARMTELRCHAVPKSEDLAPDALVERLVTKLENSAGEVVGLVSLTGLPEAAAECIRKAGLEARLAMGKDPRLTSLGWRNTSLAIHDRCSPPVRVTLSHAAAGVAETGTLVLASGRENPGSLAFLPDLHIVALKRSSVVERYETAFDIVRTTGPMPRALNLISGPSRTGDIGGRIVLGAHGPRRLVVMLYESEA